MQIFLLIAAVCFAVEALWHRNIIAAGLFFWVLESIV